MYLPMARGGKDVNIKLYNIRNIWSTMTLADQPQYSWNQNIMNTKV